MKNLFGSEIKQAIYILGITLFLSIGIFAQSNTGTLPDRFRITTAQ